MDRIRRATFTPPLPLKIRVLTTAGHHVEWVRKGVTMPSNNGGACRVRRRGFARRHAVEPVERRVLLAVDLTATANDDTIVVTANATSTTVTINGVANVVSVGPGQMINVFAGNGNDTITVEGATIPLTVQGQDGSDAIALGPAAQNLDAIEQPVTFDGGAGQDSAVLHDRTNPFDDQFSIDVDLVFRGFFGGFGYSDATESVTLNLGLGAGAQPSAGARGRGPAEGNDGSNTVDIEGVPAGTTISINAGGGDDTVSLAPTGLLLDAIEGEVLVNGEGGSDALRLSDQNNAFPDEWDITASSAVRPAFGGATYATIESLRLDAGLFSAEPGTRPGARSGERRGGGPEGGGDNVFNIASLSAPTTINGGAGDDDFIVGSDGMLAPLNGFPLTVNGQSGIDDLFVDDTFGTAADSFAIAGASVSRNGAAVVTHGTIERVHVNLGSGNNTVNLDATAANVPVTLFAGAGDDVVRVGGGNLAAIAARVTVGGEDGADSLFIDDNAVSADRDYVVSDRDVSVLALLTTLVSYIAFENFTLSATAGANAIAVEETAPATPLHIVSNAGDNTVTVNTDATGLAEVIFGGVENLAALTVNAGGRARIAAGGSNVLRLGALTVTGTGALDLTNNAVILDYDGGSPLLTTVLPLVTSGYAGGTWTGAGITSSTAAATANRAVGYGEASAVFSTFPATFAGQSVDNTTVLLRYTRYGDANLDQQVNLQDFNRLAGNFGATGTALWTQGNFNFDNQVNLQDFNRLASNFGLPL